MYCVLQLDALKTALRQMAEDKDAAKAKALAPLQQQLQVIPISSFLQPLRTQRKVAIPSHELPIADGQSRNLL